MVRFRATDRMSAFRLDGCDRFRPVADIRDVSLRNPRVHYGGLAPTAVRLLPIENKCADRIHGQRYDSFLPVGRDDGPFHHKPQAIWSAGSQLTLAPRRERPLRSRIGIHLWAGGCIHRGKRGEGVGHLNRRAFHRPGVQFAMTQEPRQRGRRVRTELKPNVSLLASRLFQDRWVYEGVTFPEGQGRSKIQMPGVRKRPFPTYHALKCLGGETAIFTRNLRLRRIRDVLARSNKQANGSGDHEGYLTTYALNHCHAGGSPENL